METFCEIGGMQFFVDFAVTLHDDFTLYRGTIALHPVLEFSYCRWRKFNTAIFSPFDTLPHIQSAIIKSIEDCYTEDIFDPANYAII